MFRFGFIFLATILVIGGVMVLESFFVTDGTKNPTVFTIEEQASLHFTQASATFRTARNTIPLTLEIADTQEQRLQGLQYRKTLEKNHGMLFLFEQEQDIAMWMANTFVPLDMLFLNRQGEVVGVIEHTTPESRTPLTIHRPSYAVLEMGAGFVQEHAIRLGDKLLYSAFTTHNSLAEPT
jgi:uncharacterized membrane protein (UPF0127 family)